MLLELDKLIEEFDLKITGIIHVGMHDMEELPIYKKCGIEKRIWIEANKSLCNKYIDTGETIVNAVISDKQEWVDFYVTTRTSSDSIYEPYMNMKFRDDISVQFVDKRLSKKLSSYNFRNQYNMLNLDIQGAELKALKGADLRYIDYIYTEVNIQDMYYNIPKIQDLDNYLQDYDRVATHIHKNKFGDALYIKKHN